MKLFTKAIDSQLFTQYSKGDDLQNQKVVAKIFNPYGRGTWYIINSDPNDPDYLWAIVDLFEVEVGSVSRTELETIKVPPFRLNLERDIYFTPVNAAKLYRDLIIKAEDELTGESEGERRAGMDEFKDGGQIDIAQQNKDMLLNYAEELEHHAEEFEEAAKKAENVEPWVVAKIERSTTDLSDVTHYLDSENEIRREYGNGEGEEYKYGGKMEDGGRVMEKGDAVIYDDQTYFITEKDGRVGLVSMRQSAAGSRPPIIDISKIDVDKEVTDMYGDKVIIPSKFERGGMMADGGGISKSVTYGELNVGQEYYQIENYNIIKIKIESKAPNGYEGIYVGGHIDGRTFASTKYSGTYSPTEELYLYETKDAAKEKMKKSFLERLDKMASGGKVKFADKVKSIKSSLLKRKKVSPSVQKDYGKTYSPKEAEESAKRIVGATTAKERLMNRMKKGKK